MHARTGWTFIVIVVSGAVVAALAISAFLLRDAERAKSCLSLAKTLTRAVRGGKEDDDGKDREMTRTRDTVNAVLDAAARLNAKDAVKNDPRRTQARDRARIDVA